MTGRRSGLARAAQTAAVAALALIAGAGCRPPMPAAGERPSVILLTVDTLRADRLGCYGHGDEISPRIDEFAADSLLFANCLSHAPETCASCASLLSGFLPHETQVARACVVSEEITTLPEILQANGYRTAAVVSNFALRDKQGFEQGFEIYDDRMDDVELNRGWPERIAERTTDRALELLRRFADEPLFLWVHYQDPHGPYTPPPDDVRPVEARSRELPLNASASGFGGIPDYQALGAERDFAHYVAHYEAEVRYLDAQVGRLLDALRETGLYDRALIVFSADHGEALGEHGYYFCHGETLYRDQTHVPLIVRRGESLRGRREELVQHVDVMPTLLRAVGLELDPRLRGRDLLGVVDVAQVAPPAVVATLHDGSGELSGSIVAEGFKLFRWSSRRREELYDLRADPGEAVDLASDPRHAETRARLGRGLAAVLADDRLRLGRAEPQPLSEEEIEKLRSLGYVH